MMTFSFMMTWKLHQYLNMGGEVVPCEWILQYMLYLWDVGYTSVLQTNVFSQENLCLNKLG